MLETGNIIKFIFEYRFRSDDRTVTCDVLIFVLSNDDNTATASVLSNRTGWPCIGDDNADNCTVFFILLQVNIFTIRISVTSSTLTNWYVILAGASNRLGPSLSWSIVWSWEISFGLCRFIWCLWWVSRRPIISYFCRSKRQRVAAIATIPMKIRCHRQWNQLSQCSWCH